MPEQEKDSQSQKDNALSRVTYNPLIFRGNYSLFLLYKRVDNLAAAVFLITNEITENDPIRMSLRKSALEAIASIVSVIGTHNVGPQHYDRLIAHVFEIGTLINTGFWAGSVSEMNASVLKKEVVKIEDTISRIISEEQARLRIDPFLFAEVDLDERHNAELRPKPLFERQASFTKPTDRMSSKGQYIKDTKRTTKPANLGSQQPEINVLEKKRERKDLILKLLREKSNLNIKDFALVITDYSEKTIQRELITLVKEGLVKRQGERRWSTYSLAG
jgi:predicted transcriptional regulator